MKASLKKGPSSRNDVTILGCRVVSQLTSRLSGGSGDVQAIVKYVWQFYGRPLTEGKVREVISLRYGRIFLWKLQWMSGRRVFMPTITVWQELFGHQQSHATKVILPLLPTKTFGVNFSFRMNGSETVLLVTGNLKHNLSCLCGPKRAIFPWNEVNKIAHPHSVESWHILLVT